MECEHRIGDLLYSASTQSIMCRCGHVLADDVEDVTEFLKAGAPGCADDGRAVLNVLVSKVLEMKVFGKLIEDPPESDTKRP